MKKTVFASLLVLAGCTTADTLTLADGTQGQMIKCGGTMNSLSSCMQKAGQVCPNGYDLIDRAERRGIASIPNSDGSVDNIATADRYLIVKCK